MYTKSILSGVIFSQFAEGYWVFSIVLEIQYPSEIVERESVKQLELVDGGWKHRQRTKKMRVSNF